MGANLMRGAYSVGRMKGVWLEVRSYMEAKKISFLSLSNIENRIPNLGGHALSTNDRMVICSIVRRDNQFEILEESNGSKILHYNGGNRT